MVLHVKIAVAKKFESNKMHLRDNQQKSNEVLESGWYKAPLSYMIYSAYYCPPFVKVGPY